MLNFCLVAQGVNVSQNCPEQEIPRPPMMEGLCLLAAAEHAGTGLPGDPHGAALPAFGRPLIGFVERPLAWLDKCRRLWKNCERILQDSHNVAS